LLFYSTDKVSLTHPEVKSIQKSYIHNIIAATFTFPLFYLFERNLMKSFRGSLVICLFSLANDVFIEYKRNRLLLKGYSQKYIR